MAPIRRTRAAEQDVEVLESASSSLRRTNKRQRLSRNHEPDESDNANDLVQEDGHGAFTATQFERLGGNREEYERLRDMVSDDDGDDESVERATQDIRRHKSLQGDMENQAADAGVIESITCHNFMCHEKLHIQLGPLINFIIGHNGSGKSAVLTALTLCLGGKATSTNRGQSLKAFIKEGQESSTLIVKIKNRAEGAFRPDIYGDSILVERHFTLQGSSAFKLKASNGRIVSTKRAELDEITDHFTMQLENPVNVLTQDMARQFLNNSTEADKYKLFVKGVQLEQLNDDYILLTDSLDRADTYFERMQADVKALESKYRKAQDMFDLSEKQNTLREKFHRMGRQMAWAQVEEQERNLDGLKRAVERTDDNIAERREDAKQYEDAYDEANNQKDKATTALKDAEAHAEKCLQVHDEASEAKAAKHREQMAHHAEEKGVKALFIQATTSVEKVEADIEEEKQRLEAADGGSTALKLGEIEAAERAMMQSRRKVEDHPAELPHLQTQKSTADIKFRDARDAGARIHEELSTANRKLDNLRGARPQRYSGYNRTPIGRIMNAIDAETKWTHKPVGPASEHVKLLKPEWSSIIEKTLGKALSSFVVTNKQDESLLKDILGRFNSRQHFPVSITKPGHMDVNGNEPDPRFDTILRVLEIDNELVLNQLVMTQAIEQVVLIKHRSEAYSFMYDGPSPRNVASCICFDPNKKNAGVRLVSSRGGGQRSDPVEPWGGPTRMQTDLQSQIRLQEEVVDSIRAEVSKVEGVVHECQTRLEECKKAVARHDKQATDLRLERDRAEDMVQKLKEELEALTPGDGKLDTLARLLVSAQEDKVYAVNQREESDLERTRLRAEAEKLQHALEGAEQNLAAATDQQKKAKKLLEEISKQREEALREKNEALARINDAIKGKEEAEAMCSALESSVAEFVEQATKICERIPVDRGETPLTLDRKLKSMSNQLDRFEQEVGGNREEVEAKKMASHEAFDQAKRQVNESEAVRHKLRMSISKRRSRWKIFRRMISSRARAMFMHLLKERAFDGKMFIDHTSKKLQLRVQPDSTQRGHEGRKTQTLSGGEKSFSTICVLLALWDAMGSPIRCLDEFDVFMDSVNREKSMDMMLHAARASVGKQYILISPQAMGKANLAGDVRIIRMSDPERGQTTLNFGESQ